MIQNHKGTKGTKFLILLALRVGGIGLVFSFLVLGMGQQSPSLAQLNFLEQKPKADTPACEPPVLSRLKRHRVIGGETVVSIANQYNLVPETLISVNPQLKSGIIPVGNEILIPPFNGIRIQAPQGATWRDLEGAYGVRADVLFEVNGCQKTPSIVFIPGVDWSQGKSKKIDYTGLNGYPLPFVAEIGLRYGWQENPTNQQSMFHSGVDLLAPVGTQVLAADSGEVIYVGQEGGYGYLIIINHPGNKQTRYAHLSRIGVRIGQPVKTGDVIGAVGTSGQPDISPPHLHFEIRYKLPVGWVAQDPAVHFQAR